MDLSVEISMYPLDKNYIEPIQNFIDRLNTHANIEVITNTMSTQIFGDYDTVFEIIKTEMKTSFLDNDKVVMVTKFINGNLSPKK